MLWRIFGLRTIFGNSLIGQKQTLKNSGGIPAEFRIPDFPAYRLEWPLRNLLIHKPQRLWDSVKHSLCELHINNGLINDYLIRAKRLGDGHVNYRSEGLLTIPCFCHSCQTPVSNDAQEA